MFSNPRANVAELGVTPGMTIVDFGAGSGEYALALAPLVGERGRVYAVEVQKELLDRLAAEARARHLSNLEIIWGNLEKHGGSKLADSSADLVLLANILFQSTARYSLALEAKRVLRPRGRAAVIDWSDSFGGLGPRADQVARPDEVKRIFAEAGFSLASEFSAGAHHYGLIFQKP
jgi:ubiquinone/menaquinone biosynthesis C-methylase UbiE